MLHASCSMEFIGNQKTVKLLDRIAKSGKIANAYIFLGPESVGKFTLAKRFATRLTMQSGKINPDLLIIEPEIEVVKGVTKKHDIKVADVRDLQRKLGLTGSGEGHRAVIIDGAERLNKAAQNALLKTLEEPNRKTVIILVSQDEDRILPTIMSRCQKIRLGTVPDEDLEKIIPGNADRKEIIFWSAGRPGTAIELSKDREGLEYRKNVIEEAKRLFSGDINERFSAAEEWSKNADEAQKKLDLWIFILREAMLRKKASIGVSPAKSLLLVEEISGILSIMKGTNANTRLVLENLFLKL